MCFFQNEDINISSAQLRVLIPVLAGLIGYLCYWFIQESPRLKNRLEEKYGQERASIRRILLSKYLGAISIGLFPFLAYKIAFPKTSLNELGFFINGETAMTSLYWIAGFLVVMVPILFFSSRSPNILAKQPEIRKSEWSRKLMISNLLAWAVYLLGYEFFFRGVLLFPLLESIGIWPAIAVNVLFYAGVHIPKGADEALGAIPLAVILCLLTLHTGTIWIAYFVHLAMAWTVSLSALKHQSNMRIINTKDK